MIRVLFVCIGNTCRSPMAEGFANYYGKGLLEASSAGVHPVGSLMRNTVDVMMEKGIDISQQTSKGLSAIKLDWLDWVIIMDVSLASAVPLPSRRTRQLHWFITDPVGQAMRVYRAVRDEIELKVLDFIETVRKEN
jgi:arsenate reductase (thioredoxin)